MRFLRIAYCELSNGQGANSNSPSPLFFVYYPEYYSGILFPATSLVLDGVPSRVFRLLHSQTPYKKNPRPVHKEPSEEREGLLMYLHLHHHLLHQLIIGAVLICRCSLNGLWYSRNDSVRSWHLTIYRYWYVDWIFCRYYWKDAYPSWSIQNTIHNSWHFTNYAAKLQIIIDITTFIIQKNYKLYQSSYFFYYFLSFIPL